jgi:hypothetical protein
MKKQNRISKKSKAAIKSAQHEALREKRSRSRVRVLMPAPLARAIRAKAKSENITVSQLAQVAIGRELFRQEPEIPENWEEVAYIDFTGYLDRTCEVRTIYKTPEGTLKALKSSDDAYNEPTVIEDVTREQVVRWLHECVIPEEFEADFRGGMQPKPGDGRQLSQLEAVQLDELYNFYSEKSFNDGMACFAGLAELLAGNTTAEVQALKRMVESERELNGIRSKARAL